MRPYQNPRGFNSIIGHYWLQEIINIEEEIKDTTRQGQFKCLYCKKIYKVAKCPYNHKLKCKKLQKEVHIHIEVRLQKSKTAKMKDFSASTAPKHTELYAASKNITQSVTWFSAYHRKQKT